MTLSNQRHRRSRYPRRDHEMESRRMHRMDAGKPEVAAEPVVRPVAEPTESELRAMGGDR